MDNTGFWPSRIRSVFLDRDGVINRKMPEGCYVTRPAELVLYPGAGAAIARLNQAGLPVFVVTNQRGVALGLYSQSELDAVHAQLRSLLAAEGARLDAIYACPHARDSCDCRKPKTGMFQQAFLEFRAIRAETSLMIGDSLPDIQAGSSLGMTTVFIEGDVLTRPGGADEARELASFTAPSLAAFVSDHWR